MHSYDCYGFFAPSHWPCRDPGWNIGIVRSVCDRFSCQSHMIEKRRQTTMWCCTCHILRQGGLGCDRTSLCMRRIGGTVRIPHDHIAEGEIRCDLPFGGYEL